MTCGELLLQRRFVSAGFICLLVSLHSMAQSRTETGKSTYVPPVRPFYFKDHDSSYYQSFERYITARVFLSQKFAGLELERASNIARFRYLPNTRMNLGVGVTYQSISLNLGYGFGFLNTDHERGKTKAIDLQTHIYGRKWTIDLAGHLHKGMYLTPRGFGASKPDSFYLRPDIGIQLLGISAYRLLNPSKFSYRAALIQNEKQKKSAGSFLVGAEIYYGKIKADSSLVPSVLADRYSQKGVRQLNFFKIGPGVGYAYTLVIRRDFFLTGSLCASLSLAYSKQAGVNGKADKFELNKAFIYRLVAGYDKNNWNVNFSLVGNQMTVAAVSSPDKYFLSSGDFRFTLARRITPGKKLSRKLHPIDNIIKDVRGIK
jgi:Domain of unknown function (DUF4421)